MENWTVGQILGTITAIAGGLTALGVITKKAGGVITKWLQVQLAPINNKLIELALQTTENDKNRAMDFIVRFLADVEQGAEVDAEEKKRFWENYDLYVSLGGNSYIHSKVERLQKEGKLK